nr:hypothetical protein [Tanacetum cinerariifolium]
MPHLPVSSRGRPLKPTLKLLELSNATGAPLPSKRKRKDGASVDRRTKQKAVKPTSAVPRFNEGDITFNRRPRGFLRRKGVAEPSGSRSVVGQASLANGMARQADVVDPNGSGAGVEVDVSEPLSEPMFCVTDQNPMDLTIEEAMKYLRNENQVSATRKVKLFSIYIS